MEVLHIVGKELQKLKPLEGNTYEFLDGDAYVVDNGNKIWIWRGKDAAVEEGAVAAWTANKLDNEERGGEPTVISVKQGDEDGELKKLVSIKVKDGDTPGFLKNAELDIVVYKLYRVYTKNETDKIDDAFVEEVPLTKKSLKSDDVYVLDGNENIYMWVGEKANREEKFEGQKLMQKIDSGRHYLPLQYTIYEKEGGKSEKAFYEFVEKAGKMGPVVSVEDQRELKYRPEESMTAEEHKMKASDVNTSKQSSDSSEKKKKGLLGKLMFWK